MTEKEMTLGTDWSYFNSNVDGWFCSEKFDGIRAFWDGKQLWTRSGNVINAPAWFTCGLTSRQLDCEIWAGRGGFIAARNAVNHGKWDGNILLIIHDVPEAVGNYAERIATAPRTTFARPVTVETVANRMHVVTKLNEVVIKGGEGLMLRNPEVRHYEKGRTNNLLKVKPH